MDNDIRTILQKVADNSISVDEAYLSLKTSPYENIDFAKVDTHRKLRQGVAEVIYGAGKSVEQIAGIIDTMKKNGQSNILITRIDERKYDELASSMNIEYFPEARIATIGEFPEPDGKGSVVIATGGTSDIPVAEEAAVTAQFLGNDVTRLYDVGVSGLHRLLDNLDDIMTANVIIAVAGMEGALASVIGGLSDCPVIAVPTSVGYGASFGGVSALLSMLNSCASGVTVVNIDNGFGAAYTAHLINHDR